MHSAFRPCGRHIAIAALCLAAAIGAAFANSARDAILATYAAAAKQLDPSFTGFSVDRGSQLWHSTHTEGNIDTPSCTTCHTKDATAPGMTRALKPIAPMAVSRTPDRFTDPEKVEKWFLRNCKTVLGRECTPSEKGDVISYLSSL
jgi:uncharacterized caspase-like protein